MEYFVLLVFCAGVALSVWIKLDMIKIKNKTNLTIKNALNDLNIISDGKRYIGENSQLIKSTPNMITTSSINNYLIKQLCKTDSNQWFIFTFNTKNGKALLESFTVEVISEDRAKKNLSDNQELYITEFGEPETA